MDRSGTAMIAFLNPWLRSLSKAMNISALDLPEAGGAFSSRYLEFRAAYARACMARIPRASVEVLSPVAAYWTVIRSGIGRFVGGWV